MLLPGSVHCISRPSLHAARLSPAQKSAKLSKVWSVLLSYPSLTARRHLLICAHAGAPAVTPGAQGTETRPSQSKPERGFQPGSALSPQRGCECQQKGGEAGQEEPHHPVQQPPRCWTEGIVEVQPQTSPLTLPDPNLAPSLQHTSTPALFCPATTSVPDPLAPETSSCTVTSAAPSCSDLENTRTSCCCCSIIHPSQRQASSFSILLPLLPVPVSELSLRSEPSRCPSTHSICQASSQMAGPGRKAPFGEQGPLSKRARAVPGCSPRPQGSPALGSGARPPPALRCMWPL